MPSWEEELRLRAIKAEENFKNANMSLFTWIEATRIAEEKCSRLTEENDLQRASIQELSGQVAKMQAVVQEAKETVARTKAVSGTIDKYFIINRLEKALAELEGE